MSAATIADVYEDAVREGLAAPLTRGQILRRLPDAMLRVYGVRQTHSLVEDNGKKARGYRGIAPRPSELPDESVGQPTTAFRSIFPMYVALSSFWKRT